MAGAAYDASDQELLLWVHATLIDSAMVAYNLLSRRSTEERAPTITMTRKSSPLYSGSKRTIFRRPSKPSIVT